MSREQFSHKQPPTPAIRLTNELAVLKLGRWINDRGLRDQNDHKEAEEKRVPNSAEILLSRLNHPGSSSEIACKFCDDLPYDQTVLSDDTAFVVASLGAFLDGWVLASPKRHVLALADLTLPEWSQFNGVLRSAQETVESAYGPTVMFEHGSAGRGRTAGCGVDHAHMHIVPIDIDLRSAIKNISEDVGEFDWVPSESKPKGLPGQDYIFIQDRTGTWISHASHLPGQVVRRAIAKTLNIYEWDWKRNRQESRVLRVAERLRGPVRV
ncbi:HIT domain-containing protein [Paenarthrobacter ureafaciens]|uniref:HIT domain-containing protein n=1 Tax=Paenarthrobacter ureafaciens TaxID=37931 RepID=UPI002DBAB8FA|nr:HIT domain-containing protein [Paenarthrobacter ureafaciens]MEC3851964.1 HIT domain-containing protein [Paenarthrobacter ureafaciens]